MECSDSRSDKGRCTSEIGVMLLLRGLIVARCFETLKDPPRDMSSQNCRAASKVSRGCTRGQGIGPYTLLIFKIAIATYISLF